MPKDIGSIEVAPGGLSIFADKAKIVKIRDIFYQGRGEGYLFHKKLFASCSWLIFCLLQGYEGKNCLQSERKCFEIH